MLRGPDVEQKKSVSVEQNAVLNFILASAQNDERPYLQVSILGKLVLCLLDSGASRTIAGQAGCEFLMNLGFRVRPIAMHCTVANGNHCQVTGVVSVPIQLREQIKILDILLVPSVVTTFILGTDFWVSFGVVPDLRRGEWKFSSEEPEMNISQISTFLTAEQQQQLDDLLLTSFPVCNDNELGCTNLVEHEILCDSPPIKQRYYPISPKMQEIVDKELNEMLRLGVVQKSTSPWSSPILLVPKRDNTYRFCVDYRKLNKVTQHDAYPLPYVSATLDKLRDARYLSSLDVKSAYWQIKMSEKSRPFTAFTVPNRGLFEFLRMPFGLMNSPSTWSRLIDRILGPELEPHVFAYLDDIIIVTQTAEKHLEVLREVFRRLSEAGLKLSKDKCRFCLPELRYLGYVVDKCGLHVDPEKVEAILKFPTPTTVTEVRRFVGMASWYRRFVPNFSTVISPLTQLLRKNTRFNWSPACENAWTNIKNLLVSAPVLACPDFSKEFIIACDASDFGVAAVLSQMHEDGERVIAYHSKSLTRQERNYSTSEKELLAVLFGVTKFRPYIEGAHFKVITDHHAIVWLHKLDNPSGRLARWSAHLSQYNFTVEHRKGRENVVPDCLSRAVPKLEAVVEESNTIADRWYTNLFHKVATNPLKFTTFRIDDNKLYKAVKSRYPGLTSFTDLWREIVPKGNRAKLLHLAHDIPTSGHLGVYKTFHRLADRYYWPKMKTDVIRYVKHCTTCIRTKPEQRKTAGQMGGHSQISRPWEVISTDLIGPLPRSQKGFQYILVVTDIFSKFTLCFPLRQATSARIVEHLENNVFLVFGVPRAIISDNGPQYKSKDYLKLLERYKIQPRHVSCYNPKANPTERVNRVIKTMLIAYVSENHRTWDKFLAQVTCALRTAKHETTELTPYFINFGHEMILSGKDHPFSVNEPPNHEVLSKRATEFAKLYGDVRSRLQKAYEKSKERYDLRHRPVQFYPNQVVWRKNFVLSDASKYFAAKLADKYIGPFLIHKRISPTTYILKKYNNEVLPGTWSVEHLKPHPGDD